MRVLIRLARLRMTVCPGLWTIGLAGVLSAQSPRAFARADTVTLRKQLDAIAQVQNASQQAESTAPEAPAAEAPAAEPTNDENTPAQAD